jgi:hypothetical protein
MTSSPTSTTYCRSIQSMVGSAPRPAPRNMPVARVVPSRTGMALAVSVSRATWAALLVDAIDLAYQAAGRLDGHAGAHAVVDSPCR